VIGLCSLRQHDLDQVIRVEHGLLLSVPHRGTPRSIVDCKYTRNLRNVNSKKTPPFPAVFVSANAAAPLFLHLQFTRAETRVKRQEIREQAVELHRLVDHWEMT
jgi:hypothetical protein